MALGAERRQNFLRTPGKGLYVVLPSRKDNVHPLKVLWLSHTLPWPPKGGLRQRSYYLLRELSRAHHVDIIALHQRAQQKERQELEEAIEALNQIVSVLAVHPLPQDALKGGQARLAIQSLVSDLPYTVRWGSSQPYLRSVGTALANSKYDLIHFDTVCLAQYAHLAQRIPCVLNHHNIESAMLARRAQVERSRLRRMYFSQEAKRLDRYERTVAASFRAHLVCSDLDGERLSESVGPGAVHVIPNGVDLEYFSPSKSARNHRPESLIFVGGLSWYPNVSAIRFFLSEVWGQLTARYPAVVFDIIGRNPPREFFQLAEADSRLRVHGFVDDIRPIVDSASVYVCPIFDGGGTKLKMIDAMAMGKAIVAHPVACEGLHLTDKSNVMIAERPDEFVEKIGQLFDDSNLREMIGVNARRHVEQNFSFRTIGARLADLYASLAAENSG